jgi:hypothetical protein
MTTLSLETAAGLAQSYSEMPGWSSINLRIRYRPQFSPRMRLQPQVITFKDVTTYG